MKTHAKLIGAIFALAATGPAVANGYFGVGAVNWTYDEEGFETADATAMQFTIGNELNEHVAIETRFAFGGSDSVPVTLQDGSTVDVEAELDHAFSFLVKPHTGGEDFRGYGLLGFSQGELTFTGGGVTTTDSDSGLSYGAGVEAQLGDGVWVGGEYVHYLDEEFYDFTATTVGVRFAF